MSDPELRALERRLDASPDDQSLLAQVIGARRRARLPVDGDLLGRRRFPARTFNASFRSRVDVDLGAEGQRLVGVTPAPGGGGLDLPERAAWCCQVQPADDEEARRIASALGRADPDGVVVDSDHLGDEGFRHLGALGAGLRSLILAGARRLTDVALAALLQPLVGLERLSIADAPEVGSDGFRALAALPWLDELALQGRSSWVGPDLRDLAGAPCLTGLRLVGCPAHLAALAGVRSLQRLHIADSPGLVGHGLAPLKNLTRLEELSLSGCGRIRDEELALACGLPRLRALDVGDTREVTERGLAALVGTRLKRLSLDVEWAGGGALSHLPDSLESLTLFSTQVEDAHTSALERLGRLETLELYLSEVGDAGYAVLSALPALRTLLLHPQLWRGDTTVTDGVFEHLAAASGLESLDLEVPCGAGLSLLAGLPLRTLRLHQARPQALGRLSDLEGLEELSLYRCDVSPQHLVGLDRLRVLGLARCLGGGFLARGDLGRTLQGLPALQEVTLSDPALTDADLAGVADATHLHRLSFVGCPRVTAAARRRLQERLPGCWVE